MVDAPCAGRDTLRRGSGGLDLAPHDGAFLRAGFRPRWKVHFTARLTNYGRLG